MPNKKEGLTQSAPVEENPPQQSIFNLAQEQLLTKVGWRNKTFSEVAGDTKTIEKLKGSMEHGRISQSEFIMAVGMIAHTVKQDTYKRTGVFLEQKDFKDIILKKAIYFLRSWEVKPTNQTKYSPEEWQERVAAAEKAHAWLKSFEPKPVAEAEQQSDIEQPKPQEIIASVLNFEVLPNPKNGESVNAIEFLKRNFGGIDFDEKRITFLTNYIERFNGELFISKFGRTTSADNAVKIPLYNQDEAEKDPGFKFNYLVAVFDKPGAQGLRKFALAEYIRKNQKIKSGAEEQRIAHGAIYVFEEKPHSELNWQFVLSKTRERAKALGAKKISHIGEFAERLEKFLNS